MKDKRYLLREFKRNSRKPVVDWPGFYAYLESFTIVGISTKWSYKIVIPKSKVWHQGDGTDSYTEAKQQLDAKLRELGFMFIEETNLQSLM